MTLDELIEELRARQSRMPDWQRLELWESLMEGYCTHCATELKKEERCYCTCDE